MSTRLGKLLKEKGQYITCAESCTGGWIAKTITDIAGSSGWFERGFVTYSNQAKSAMLGVRPSTLEQHGAVSAPVVHEMALGALAAASADYAVAVSGIAGPDGGTLEKPVGTVWFGWATRQGVIARHQLFTGDRDAIRAASVIFALNLLLDGTRQ